MVDEIKCITKRDVKPGMFVSRYGLGTFNDPYVDVGRFIDSYEDITKYLPEETESVEIIPDRICARKAAPLSLRSAGKALHELGCALPAARKVHDEALLYARKFIDDIRNGRELLVEEAAPIVDQVIDSISLNEPAALTIAFLKKYDEYTYTHSINVNLFSLMLGKALGYGRDKLRLLGVAAMFHDVGKGRIPNYVLNKPGKLTDAEFEIMKGHSLQGLNVLKDVDGLDDSILRGVVEHHERYDGNGYPRQLKGAFIHPFARIIAISDVYDALTSVRVYKKAMTPSCALGLMYKWKGTDFDPDFFKVFTRVIGVYPPGSLVELECGKYAIVIETNEHDPLRPKVKLLFDAKVRPIISQSVDLADTGAGKEYGKVVSQKEALELGLNMRQLSRFLI